MYKEVVTPFKDWAQKYQDYLQMQAFDTWLTKSLNPNYYLTKKERREYICVISHLSDELIARDLLVKSIFNLRLPFNSNDLISLIKRTNILEKFFPDDLEEDIEEGETENILIILKLYAAFLNFRPLNPSEKNNYNSYHVIETIPKGVRVKNNLFFFVSQIIIVGLIVSTLIASWVFLDVLYQKIIVSVISAAAVFFDVFYLLPSYYMRGIIKAIQRKDFVFVLAKITDVSWLKSNISGIKRIPHIEYTTEHNETDEKFHLHSFSSTPPKAGDKRYIPITFVYNYNLIIDAPFSLEYVKKAPRTDADLEDFKK